MHIIKKTFLKYFFIYIFCLNVQLTVIFKNLIIIYVYYSLHNVRLYMIKLQVYYSQQGLFFNTIYGF